MSGNNTPLQETMEEMIEHVIEDEEVHNEKLLQNHRKKSVAPRKGIKKSNTKLPRARALPRPYKHMPDEKLSDTIYQLEERVEVAENRLKTYTIRLKKLLTEKSYQQSTESADP